MKVLPVSTRSKGRKRKDIPETTGIIEIIGVRDRTIAPTTMPNSAWMTRIRRINAHSFGAVYLLFILTACSGDEVFSEYHSFPEASWSQKEKVSFAVNIEDSLQHYAVFIELRNNNHYPFRNIWLFVDFATPDGKQRRDSIEVNLADEYGKWYGSGISLYTYSFFYEKDIQYPTTGTYNYSITQGMREDPLTGISDIGLTIKKR
jgi:gliding motility-associated lipoprotein GldH